MLIIQWAQREFKGYSQVFLSPRLWPMRRNLGQLPVAELAQVALAEWLEEQARLEPARRLMRELGQGLGQGCGAHDIARNHDACLYPRAR